jgi:hypothetical protein
VIDENQIAETDRASKCGPIKEPEDDMKVETHAPSQTMLVVSLLLALLAVLGAAFTIPFLSSSAFLLAILAYVVLAFSNMVKT